MARYLLDTTVLIDVLRGRPAADRILATRGAGPIPFVCAINVEEVTRGVRPSEEEAALGLLRALEMAPLTREEGELAGRWRRRFAEQGITLSQADCLIAAAALGVDATLATGNPADFPMSEVRIEHWPVGS